MAKMVNELVGNEVGVEYRERRDWDVKHRLLSSIEKAKRLLGYAAGGVRGRLEARARVVYEELGDNKEECGVLTSQILRKYSNPAIENDCYPKSCVKRV